LQQSIGRISLSSICFLFSTPKHGTDRPKQIGDRQNKSAVKILCKNCGRALPF
jgi:hypothetical protein